MGKSGSDEPPVSTFCRLFWICSFDPDYSVWFKACSFGVGNRNNYTKNGNTHDRCSGAVYLKWNCYLLRHAIISKWDYSYWLMYIAPCEKRKEGRMSQILVFNNAECTIWSHAKCIHLTGIYSMLSIKTGWEVHNDIQLISKKELNAYSVLQQIDRKKTRQKVLGTRC